MPLSRCCRALSLFALILLSVLGTAGAATLAINPIADNTLYQPPSGEGEASNGAGSFLFAGLTTFRANSTLRRGLLEFDIASQLPENAVITGASLTLYLSRTAFGTGNAEVTLHKLLAGWGEGTSNAGSPGGNGAIPTTNDATWTYRFFEDETRRWVTPGGDFVAQVSASATVGETFEDVPVAYTWTGAGLLADVQSWYQNPGADFGWIIRGNEDLAGVAKRFNSSEHPDVSTRPLLTIEYEIVPEPSTAAALLVGIAMIARRRPKRRVA